MSIFLKSFLTVSLLGSSFLPGTANDPGLIANANCEPANQRNITVRVEHKAGAPVDNLHAADLSLLEDKTSREILKLENRTNESVAVAVLIDTSASQELSLPQTKLAAQDFVELALHTNNDRAALISFAGEATAEETLTNNLADLHSAISRVRFVPPAGYAGGGIVVSRTPPRSNSQQMLASSTAIWDAVWTATDELLKGASGSRRAVVLFTDGEDTSSKKKLSEAIEHASRNDVAVFAIGVGNKEFGGPNHDVLGKLTEETGGRAFFPKKAPEQSEMLRQIDQELRSDYLLTYCASSADVQKKPFKLKIQFTNPQVREADRLFYKRYAF